MQVIAIIGASNNRAKFGNKAVRAYLKKGWRVYPVNHKENRIESLKMYASILDVPGGVDHVAMYVPPAVGLTLINDIAQKKPKVVCFNPGSESDELVAKARQLGLHVILACSIKAIGEDPADYN